MVRPTLLNVTSVFVLALAGITAACGDQKPQNELLAPTDPDAGDVPPPPPPPPVLDAATPTPTSGWDDAQGLAWLTKACAECHGISESGDKAPYYSGWPMPATPTREWLETSDYTALAYQSILHRATNVPGPPSPMPLHALATDEQRKEVESAIEWFQRAVPFSVIDANKRYGNSAASQTPFVVNFRCETTMSLRKFLPSITYALLDRPPTFGEMSFFSHEELDAPVTARQREHIVYWFENEWRSQFMQKGLRKFANAVGGAPGIDDSGGYSATVTAALREEFYRLLVSYYDQWNYGDYFAKSTVMVSADTAPLYGCPVPTGGTWAPCELAAPRRTFFGSLGFLVSSPSSFLSANNNYGRVAAVFFTLYGEALLAATAGPTGDVIPPLPTCLEENDMRMFDKAPRGTASVPLSGSVCQGCHVARGLAAGSILFRPFGSNGRLFDVATLGQAGSPDKSVFDTITADDTKWEYLEGGAPAALSTPGGKTFLSNLLATSLTGTPKACVATGNKTAPFVNVTNLSELVSEYLKNASSFSRGFARHAQRALFNQNRVTLEMGVRVGTAYEAGEQRLPDLFRTYLSSESLTCEP